MAVVTRLSSKGQVVIPAWIRRRLGMSAGDRLTIEVQNGSGAVTLRPLTAHDLQDSIRKAEAWFASEAVDPVQRLHAMRREARTHERARRRS